MTDENNEQQPDWPKDVLIRQTLDAAAADLDEDYDQESDGGATLLNEVGESYDTITLESWAEIPAGYEPVLDDQGEIDSYEEYLRSKHKDD